LKKGAAAEQYEYAATSKKENIHQPERNNNKEDTTLRVALNSTVLSINKRLSSMTEVGAVVDPAQEARKRRKAALNTQRGHSGSNHQQQQHHGDDDAEKQQPSAATASVGVGEDDLVTAAAAAAVAAAVAEGAGDEDGNNDDSDSETEEQQEQQQQQPERKRQKTEIAKAPAAATPNKLTKTVMADDSDSNSGGKKKTQIRYDPEIPMSKEQLAAWRRYVMIVLYGLIAVVSRAFLGLFVFISLFSLLTLNYYYQQKILFMTTTGKRVGYAIANPRRPVAKKFGAGSRNWKRKSRVSTMRVRCTGNGCCCRRRIFVVVVVI